MEENSMRVLPTCTQFNSDLKYPILKMPDLKYHVSKNIAPKLDLFTKLKQIFRKLKVLQDKLKKFCEKLKVSPTRVGLACGKMSNKKACQVFFV